MDADCPHFGFSTNSSLLCNGVMRNLNWLYVILSFIVANSPRVGSGADTVARVVIRANDNANGVLQLSHTDVIVREEFSSPILYVERSAGLFGEVC